MRKTKHRRPGSKRRKAVRAKPLARTTQLAVPAGSRATPYLIIKDAARAVDFYRNAFDAIEVIRLEGADGRIAHCEPAQNRCTPRAMNHTVIEPAA